MTTSDDVIGTIGKHPLTAAMTIYGPYMFSVVALLTIWFFDRSAGAENASREL
jgi:hypothetical protein